MTKAMKTNRVQLKDALRIRYSGKAFEKHLRPEKEENEKKCKEWNEPKEQKKECALNNRSAQRKRKNEIKKKEAND